MTDNDNQNSMNIELDEGEDLTTMKDDIDDAQTLGGVSTLLARQAAIAALTGIPLSRIQGIQSKRALTVLPGKDEPEFVGEVIITRWKASDGDGVGYLPIVVIRAAPEFALAVEVAISAVSAIITQHMLPNHEAPPKEEQH